VGANDAGDYSKRRYCAVGPAIDPIPEIALPGHCRQTAPDGLTRVVMLHFAFATNAQLNHRDKPSCDSSDVLSCALLRETQHDRTLQAHEGGICHADRIDMRTRVEFDFGLFRQCHVRIQP